MPKPPKPSGDRSAGRGAAPPVDTGGTPDAARTPDTELTRRVQAGAPVAGPAIRELRRRHTPAVLAYARLATRSEEAAEQLGSQAFARAAAETCRGVDPEGPWGHHLLLLVRDLVSDWVADGRETRLAPGLADWIEREGRKSHNGPPTGASPALRAAFDGLPLRTRGLLWYGVVEEEPPAEVALLLGVVETSVPEERSQALDALHQASAQRYAEDARDPACRGFQRLIEAATRADGGQRDEHLDEHLAECPHCARATEELERLAADPRAAMADALLGWGGAEYVAACPPRGSTGSTTATPDVHDAAAAPAMGAAPVSRPGGGAAVIERWALPFILVVMAAVAVSAVVLLTPDAGERSAEGLGDAVPPPVPAPRTPTAATSTATTSGPPEKATPSRTRSRATGKPTPTRTAPERPSATAPAVLGGTFTPVVNAGSGLCLDVESPDFEKRPDVITVPCNGSPSQQWRLDEQGLVHLRADPDFCLDSQGNTQENTGIWPCNPIEGDQPQNLVFTADPSGTVRPLIAPDFALTPLDSVPGAKVGLRPVEAGDAQRWTAGSPPAA
ncbi:ricin-type beta-trefoil lectin domain protein [Streptomyces sp. NPDC051776]|uniref:ricin-type beta-trefoil lectin domain protein n=1 Tax=Streptomyces sp. NPDC051776 TaxID=3155414 RepID=UPI003431BD7B